MPPTSHLPALARTVLLPDVLPQFPQASPTLLLSRLEAPIPGLASILLVQESRRLPGALGRPTQADKWAPTVSQGGPPAPTTTMRQVSKASRHTWVFYCVWGNQEASQLVTLLTNVGKGLFTTSERAEVCISVCFCFFFPFLFFLAALGLRCFIL